MKFIHPLVMIGFFVFLYWQRALGQKIAEMKEKSPEFVKRPGLLEQHRTWGYALTGLCLAGLFGGIFITSSVLGAQQPFLQTYGHGFIGSVILGCLVMSLLLGLSIKNVVKPRIRERFLTFHMNMVYVIAAFGLLSAGTGLAILIWGLSPLN
ncbi:MAG: hypothetical protein OZSIB_2747 [Candidatus Ozemobacter sibiricus]|uniref:Uncharacterized protein n=1 Tax=Candidatus Ozemobacter sibiricus TaxID=2268124 RepID=A0A367ZT26_9BACT|nr:MAG: hypothetical protein OZSIB_2747 [Candidatus Ozemobacter sibiricus]